MSACADIQHATPQHFRRVIGSFATGVAVVTTEVDEALFGMTINSLTSVSLDPLLVLVCLVKGSRTGQAIQQRGRFAINLLADHQEDISRRFVSKDFQHRFQDGDTDPCEHGVPLLKERLAHVVCDVHSIQTMGDHDVIYGQVVDCDAADGKPLVYWKGSYAQIGERQAVAGAR
jgi:3-hydroxy-9,10-secoandrosta-1,3,5(10)-triene-9,17-dione monooxygenase reductase component